MRNTLTALALFTALIVQAQDPQFQWATTTTSGSPNNGYDIAVDANGDIYYSGTFWDTTDFDPGPGIMGVPFSVPHQTMVFLCKATSNGSLIWVRGLFCATSLAADGLALDASGNPIVVGYFDGPTDFDPGPDTLERTPIGEQDAFVCKFDPSGDLIWARTFGGPENDAPQTVTTDPQGNVYVGGGFSGTMDLDPGVGTYAVTSNGDGDAFAMKLDPNGDLIWGWSMGGIQGDVVRVIEVDVNGDLIVAGSFKNTVDVDPGPAVSTFTSAGGFNAFVSKFTSGGQLIWVKQLASPGSIRLWDLDVDPNGHIWSTGHFVVSCDLDPGAGTLEITGVENHQCVFVSCIDAQGEAVWGGGILTDGSGGGWEVDVDNAGHVWVTGDIAGSADLDPSAGSFSYITQGYSDIFYSVIDTSGNFLWAAGIGGADRDEGTSIAFDGQGGVYTTGSYAYQVDMDPGPSTTILNGGGLSPNTFVAKYQMDPGSGILQEMANKPSLSPNPSDGTFTLSVDVNSLPLDFLIVDAMGRVLQQGNITDPISHFELPHAPGMYTMHTRARDGATSSSRVAIR